MAPAPDAPPPFPAPAPADGDGDAPATPWTRLRRGLAAWWSPSAAAPNPRPPPAAPEWSYLPTARPDAGEGIEYDPHLLRQLVHDHRELVRLLAGLHAPLAAGRFAEIEPLLEAFQALYDRHLLTEGIHLYGYLEQQAHRQSPAEGAAFVALRAEMNGLSLRVRGFVRRWLAAAPDAFLRDEFAAGLALVEDALRERTGREERELYPLYRPLP